MNKLVNALFSEVQDIEGMQKEMSSEMDKFKDDTANMAQEQKDAFAAQMEELQTVAKLAPIAEKDEDVAKEEPKKEEDDDKPLAKIEVEKIEETTLDKGRESVESAKSFFNTSEKSIK